MKSKEEMIKNHEKYINFVINDLHLGHRRDELFDVGMIGFVNGINTYDETKGFELTTYLYTCIKNEILHLLTYETRERRMAEIVSLNTLVDEGETTELQDFIGKEEEYERKIFMDELMYIIERRLSFMTERQQNIFNDLYGYNGHKQLSFTEAAKKYKTTRQNIYDINRRIIKNLKGATWNLRENYYEGLYDKKD